MPLQAKKVVIIGGSSGIGLATAKAVSSAGANVLIASRSEEKLRKAKAEIGGNTEMASLDITQEKGVKDFFERVGPFDHLVITAAVVATGPFLKLDASAARSVFDSKFWG